MARPVILILASHYLPGFKAGGPVRSIANLVETLGDEFEFRILCADRDLGDKDPYQGIERDRWVMAGPAPVHYTSPALLTPARLSRLIRQTRHDVLYLNSFFSPHFSVSPLVARRLGLIPRQPLVIAPRGEFSPGALELKRIKKSAYIALGRSVGLFGGLTWQASSGREEADIRAALGRSAGDVQLAMDLPDPLTSLPPPHTPRRAGEPLRLLFLSRISPKKNLDYALRVLARVKAPTAFSICGPSEDDAYRADCERLAAQLPPHVSVSWKGAINPADVAGVMAAHDLFFLPTRGENYGHVIAEAFSAGTPALISDTTPWRGLLQSGAGEDLPLADPDAFAVAIDRAASTSPQEEEAMRERVFACALRRQRESADVEANRRLFLSVMGDRSS